MPTPVIIAGDVMVGEMVSAPLDREPIPDPDAIALASPKSSTLTVPSGRTLIFAGFRSR